jgi:hypothetical protein
MSAELCGYAGAVRKHSQRVPAGVQVGRLRNSGQEAYGWPFLSVKFPNLDVTKEPTIKQRVAIERRDRMAADVMARLFGADAGTAASELSMACVAKTKGCLCPAKIIEGLAAWLSGNGINIEWSGSYGN